MDLEIRENQNTVGKNLKGFFVAASLAVLSVFAIMGVTIFVISML